MNKTSLLILLLLLLASGRTARAGEIVVTAGDDLVQAVAQANPGDTLQIRGGIYSGPLLIDKPLTLVGIDWPVVDGGGRGSVLHVTAPGTVITGIVVRDSGDSLDQENSGIVVEAGNVTIQGNRLEETLFGIYLRHADDSILRGNVIASKQLPAPRRGDPIRVWYSNEVVIEDNRIDKGRDVVLWYSEGLAVRNNDVSNGRYGLHFMYCDDALIEQNRLLNNSVGAFLMYSRRLQMRDNTVAYNRGPSGYGVGLKDMDDAVVENNMFLDNRIGAHLDNSPREVDSIGLIEGNVFAYNDIGIQLLPSVRHNRITRNSFVENQEQVAIAGGGRQQENWWNVDGVGNYWSDYAGFDADGDGRGDIAYKSERLFENLADNNPHLRLFLFSPATNAIDFAAEAFPFVKPQPKLVDEQPLLDPVIPATAPTLPPPPSQNWAAASLGFFTFALGMLLFSQITLPSRRQLEHADLPPGDLSGENSMIQVKNLTKRFGRLTAVDNLSFEMAAGQAVALWGANGAGKSTALHCLLDLTPYEGEITISGLDASRDGEKVRALIGFVPQDLNFHNDLTVQETVQFYSRLKRGVVPESTVATRLQSLGLANHTGKLVGELSGGLKQRLALALALLSDPPLLLLDEPTASLDVGAREEFIELLLELKEAGKTILFSSHRLEEVGAVADRILVMAGGALVADCMPSELDSALRKVRQQHGGLETPGTSAHARQGTMATQPYQVGA